eukprot:Sspe_Gene.22817::Locus_8759_Transcript_1_2_Confidence_0.667_Length_2101::g.22817::m.22817
MGGPCTVSFKEGLVVAVVAVLPFSNSLFGDLVLDDHRAIRDNKDLRPDAPWSALLDNDFWGTPIASNASHKSWRPLTVLTFRLTFAVAELNTWAYHAGNLVLHAAATVGVLHLLRTTGVVQSKLPSLLAAMLFGVHPVHVENVSSLVGRADTLCLLWVVAMLCAYMVGTKRAFLLALVCHACAVASKEVGIVGLSLCAFHELLVHGPSKRWFVRTALAATWSVLLLVMSMRLRGALLTPKMSYIDNPIAMGSSSSFVKLLQYSQVHAQYATLLVWPQWLCSDWGYDVIPLVSSLADLRLLPSLLVYSALLSLAMLRDKMVLFSLACLVLPFLPASGIVAVGTVLAERLLYLPSLGFVMLVGRGLQWVEARCGARRGWLVAVVLVLVLLSGRSWCRSADWGNAQALYSGTVASCPRSAKGHFSLGVVHMQQGNPSLAKISFTKAYDIHPSYPEALVALGRLKKDEGDLPSAEDYFTRAIRSEPLHVEAHQHLGIVKAMQGNATLGVALIAKSMRLAKNLLLPGWDAPEVLSNYATALGLAGRLSESVDYFHRALKGDASLEQKCAWRRNLLVVLQAAKQAKPAAEVALQLVRQCPLDPTEKKKYTALLRSAG